jgi:DNA ligase (NAD+)
MINQTDILVNKLRDSKDFSSVAANLSLRDLQQIIDKADNAYYRTGQQPILTDTEYDLLRAKLGIIAPDDERLRRVGTPYSVSELRNKVHHPIPMGSLDNTEDGVLGYQTWLNKVGLDQTVMASLKIDGASVRVRYVDGKLTQVATRGNGEIGEDITANGVSFQGLPTILSDSVTVDIRGEAILFIDDYKMIRERDLGMPFEDIPERDRSNPRNIGNGILGRDDGKDSEKIRFIAFNIVCDDKQYQTESEKFEHLERLGFEIVPHYLCSSVDQLTHYYNVAVDKRNSYPFEIDGIVVCLDNVALQRSLTTDDLRSKLRPKYARAIKFPHKSGITKIESVFVSHGHTGALVPTAKLQEVRIGGVNVTHALLNNWDEISRLSICIGDKVEVVLAGDIIPKIIRVVEEGENRVVIQEPQKCPSCEFVTTREIRGKSGAVTYCSNPNCSPARMGKIKHWIGTQKKGVGILGIGDSILKALYDNDIVTNPADLYTLSPDAIKDVQLDNGVRVGLSRAIKIVQEIQEKRKIPLSTFLGSLGINLLGRRRVQQLQQAANGKLDSLDQWLDRTNIENLDLPGLGNALRSSILEGIENNRILIQQLLDNGVEIQSVSKVASNDKNVDLPFEGMSFCLTGTRAFQDEIQELGGTIKSGVSKNLTFLVQKDPLSMSNKTQKAESYGVKIISIEYLEKAVKGEVDLKKMVQTEVAIGEV